jgi:sugar (pentulose or hexulose) kinase
MHGFMLFSGTKAVTEYISWQDMRCYDENGSPGIAARIKDIAGDEIFRRNGVVLKNNHSLCPLYHLLNEKYYSGKKSSFADTRLSAGSGALQFSMMGDALIRNLTGKVPPIHPTPAASSGLYDLEKKNWNWELIRILSLDEVQFPNVSDGKEPAAHYREKGRNIPIYAAIGDQQVAALGCGASGGDIVINIGTGGQICYIDEGMTFGNYETRPYFSGGTLRSIAQLPSGRTLNILMDFVLNTGKSIFNIDFKADSQLWDKLNKLAEEAASTSCGHNLRLSMSFFDPPGASISGVDNCNLTMGNLFTAAYQNMADSYYDAFTRIGLNGKRPKSMIGVGGIIQKTPLLRRLLGERFGLPLWQPPNTNVAMCGLLRLGRWYGDIDSEIFPLKAEEPPQVTNCAGGF